LVKNYSELIVVVQAVESAATNVEFNSIDISAIENKKPEMKKPNFKPMLDLAVAMEAGYVNEAQQRPYVAQQPQQGPQEQVKQVVQMQVGTQTTQNTVYVPQQVQAPQQKPTPAQSVKDEVGNFADNLTKSAQVAAQSINTFSMKVKGEDDLILPKLTVSDQITELERMIEGIKSSSFSPDQIKIIKSELNGLNEELAQQKSQQGATAPVGIDQQLLLLRNTRLSEVMMLVSGAK
jgi:hypothetical protein